MKEVAEDIMKAYTGNEYTSVKRHIVRGKVPEEAIRQIEEVLGERHLLEGLRLKYSREASDYRAFVTYVMRVLCGFTYKGICEYIGNMSMSGIANLSNRGYKLLIGDMRYRNAFNCLARAG